MGTLGEYSVDTLEAAAARALQIKLEFFEPQALSNLVWGMAKLSVRPASGFYEAASLAAQGMSESLNAQHISNLAYSFARMGIRDEVLFASLSAAAQSRIHEFTSVGLQTTAY